MKSLTIALIVVVFAVTYRADDKTEWKEFTCKDGRFQLLMPGTPKQNEAETESDFGPGVLHMYTVGAGDSLYGAYYCDFPEGVKEVPLEQVYNSLREGASKNIRGKMLSEEEIKLGDHPGREIRIEVNGGKLFFRARVFLVGSRLYQVATLGPKEAATSKDADEFLDSFKLTD